MHSKPYIVLQLQVVVEDARVSDGHGQKVAACRLWASVLLR